MIDLHGGGVNGGRLSSRVKSDRLGERVGSADTCRKRARRGATSYMYNKPRLKLLRGTNVLNISPVLTIASERILVVSVSSTSVRISRPRGLKLTPLDLGTHRVPKSTMGNGAREFTL